MPTGCLVTLLARVEALLCFWQPYQQPGASRSFVPLVGVRMHPRVFPGWQIMGEALPKFTRFLTWPTATWLVYFIMKIIIFIIFVFF